jgi:hypothetical protein
MANQKGVNQDTSKEAFIEAMYKTFGNVSASCRVIGISRMRPYAWAKDDPDFKAKFESKDYEEAYLDDIERKLAKLGLQDENPTVLIFLAKTKAKKRGYVESQETKHTGIPAPINIIVSSKENAEKLENFMNNVSKSN